MIEIGQKFGQLTVIEKEGNVIWCICDCGEKIRTQGAALVNGKCRCNKPIERLFDIYKKSAKERGYEFVLSISEFRNLVSQNCFYCNIQPNTNISRYGIVKKYNGIDRFDNKIGYKLSNCVPCCWYCNSSKGTRTPQQFKEWVTNIYNFYVQSSNSHFP